MKALITRLVIQSIGTLPLSWARGIGHITGLLGYKLNQRAAKVTRKNLSMCYPQLNAKDIETLCKKSLIETGKTGAEICLVWQRSVPYSLGLIKQVEGLEIMEDAIQQKRGIVLLAPHLGNWEILGVYLATLAKTVNLYQPAKNAALSKLMLKGREKSGAELAPTSPKGVIKLLKNLKAGGICGILPDQVANEDSGGVFAPFFGHPAHTVTLAQNLIRKQKSVAVLAFAKRIPGGFKIIFRQPDEEIYNADTFISTSALNKSVENLINEAVEQYQWEYKRFKKTPPGIKINPYKGLG